MDTTFLSYLLTFCLAVILVEYLYQITEGDNKKINTKNFKVDTDISTISTKIAKKLEIGPVSFDEVIQTNIDKLMKRYPDGFFDVYYSENREEGDI